MPHGASVAEGRYGGLPAQVLRSGTYEALALPEVGGQLVALRDRSRGLRFLREPLEGEGGIARYLGDPVPYGMPLLFPPNRIDGGRFTFLGRTYDLGINEPALRNHLHGFFQKAAFDVVERGSRDGQARVVLRSTLREGDGTYRVFPHRATLELRYLLEPERLHHEVRVRNDGEEPMPLLVGFHTAVAVPFTPGGEARGCTVSVNIGREWELSERKLPTGRTVPMDAMAQAIAQGGGDPFAHPVDALFSASPGEGPNRCTISDPGSGVRLVYETGREFLAWMLWNRDARSRFFCPEPMTCLVNAPNLSLPQDESGMRALLPGEVWSAQSCMYIQNL